MWKSICPLMKGTMLLRPRSKYGTPTCSQTNASGPKRGQITSPGGSDKLVRGGGGGGVGTVIVWG